MSGLRGKDIPKSLKLRKLLGVGTRGERESIEFRRVFESFRENWRKDELRGASLRKWDDRDVQRGLELMAEDFLDTQGCGPRFWPDRGPAVKALKLLKDRVVIKELIKQLLFRQNEEKFQRKKPEARASRASRSRMITLRAPSNNRDNENARRPTTLQSEISGPELEQHSDHFVEFTDAEELFDVPDNFVRDPFEVPSSPHRLDEQNPTEDQSHGQDDNQQCSEPRPNDAAPIAPHAPMTEEPTISSATNLPTGEEAGPQKRVRKPTWRSLFASTPDSDVDEDSDAMSPEPGDGSDTDFMPSPSPPTADVMSPVSMRSMPFVPEQPTPSVKQVPSQNQANTARSMMPPPCLPMRVSTTPGAARKREYLVNYYVLTSARHYEHWDHHGTFKQMSMGEFEKCHNFTNMGSVHFRIVAPSMMSRGREVRQGDDFTFQGLKTMLKNFIKQDLLGNDGKYREAAQYEVLIEPGKSEDSSTRSAREQTVNL